MPDHVHLLVQGKTGDADLKKFVTGFKQKSGYEFKRKYHRNLWHVSFYDPVLRKEENVLETIKYILNNPVRKGLVDDYKKYRLSGAYMPL